MRRRSVTTLFVMGLMVVIFASAAYAYVTWITCTGGECFGTRRADILNESPGDDQIYGKAGPDRLADAIYYPTYSGDTEILSGGRGSDWVDGSDRDTLDTVAGNRGTNDTCWITKNLDTDTSDTLGGGCETVYEVTVGTGWRAPTITCTGGECFGTESRDILQESLGDDQIYGIGGDDEIRGYTCADIYCEAPYIGPDTDVLSGGDGSDLVDAGDDDTLDTVSGGEGTNDTCAITINLDSGDTDTIGEGCETVTVSGTLYCDEDAHTGDPDFAGCEAVRFCRC